MNEEDGEGEKQFHGGISLIWIPRGVDDDDDADDDANAIDDDYGDDDDYDDGIVLVFLYK